MAKKAKYVYFFGNGKADGNRHMKDLLGGKGSGLAEMTNAGLPVPPGFTISTAVCSIYYKEKSKIPSAIEREIAEQVKKLEQAAGANRNGHRRAIFIDDTIIHVNGAKEVGINAVHLQKGEEFKSVLDKILN